MSSWNVMRGIILLAAMILPVPLAVGTPHYSLIGSSGQVRVVISLDDWILPWLVEALREDEPAAVRRALDDPHLTYIDAALTNLSSHDIELSVFTDVLIFGGGDQAQFRPDPASIAGYPVRLLPGSRTTIRFVIPAGDERMRAANTAAYLTGAASANISPRIDLRGELILGSVDLSIPFTFETER